MVVTTVNWERMSGEQVQELAAALILMGRPNGNVITPSRGDRGIDLRIASDTGFDVYQIKRFTRPLSSAQQRDVEQSWTTFISDGSPRLSGAVSSWTLVMPWDPTGERLEWLEGLTDGCGFTVQWLGRNQLDTMAADNPHLVAYYLGDGLAEVKRLMTLAITGDVPVDQSLTGDALLSAISEREIALANSLDAVDPFYRYEIHVRPGPVPERWDDAVADAEAILVIQQQISSDEHAVTRILPRYPWSTWLRPISQTVEFEVEPGTDEYAAIRQFQEFGAPFSDVPMTTVRATGPPGTTRLGRARNLFRPTGRRCRLRVRATQSPAIGAEPIASLPLVGTSLTSGLVGNGMRVTAADASAVLSVEAVFGNGGAIGSAHYSGFGVARSPDSEAPTFGDVPSRTDHRPRLRDRNRRSSPITGGVYPDETFVPFDRLHDRRAGTVQRHTGEVITLPEHPSQREVDATLRVASILKHGSIVEPWSAFD